MAPDLPHESDASAAREPRRGFRAAWQHRRWRWALASVVVSLAGDLLYWVALIAFLADDGARWVAIALVVRLVPYIVIGPFGGAVADRFDRRRLLITLDLCRIVIFATMALLVAVDGPKPAAVALVALSGVAGTMYRPALAATTPFLVTESDLGAANAAEASLAQLSLFVGPALGAGLVAVFDPSIVILIDAATFAVSALLLTRIGHVGGGRRAQAAGGRDDGAAADQSTGILRETLEGFRVVKRDRGLTALVALITAVMFAFGAEQVLYVLVAKDRLDLGPEGVGVLMAAMGLGGLAMAPFSARIGSSSKLGWWTGIAGAGVAAPLALMGSVGSTPAAVALASVEGAAVIVFEIGMITLLQRAVAEEMVGRVYSVQDAVSAVGESAGSAIAPVLASGIGLAFALRTTGLIGLIVCVVTVPALAAMGRRLEARRLEYREMTDWLGGLDAFASYEPVQRERLARAATEVRATAGQAILVEGSEPDDLYVVRRGRLAVTSRATGDRPLPDLVANDVFGEIGLLRGIARTATVTATEDTDLVRIAGRVFVDVAGSGTHQVDPIAGGMRTRLGRTHPHMIGADASHDGDTTA